MNAAAPVRDDDESMSTYINVESLQKLWLPKRALRFGKGEMKIRGFEDGPLCRGDYVLNSTGGAATMSLCFKKGPGTSTDSLWDISIPMAAK
jgi:hypothetical protein